MRNTIAYKFTKTNPIRIQLSLTLSKIHMFEREILNYLIILLDIMLNTLLTCKLIIARREFCRH